MTTLTRRTIAVDDYLLTWMEAFLIDRKARGSANGTQIFYAAKLRLFSDYCEGQAVTQISQITPTLIREYLLDLERKHNPGGRHAAFRTLRAFLYWYEAEVEPEGWKNPARKVKAPRVGTEPLEPVSFDAVSRMIGACQRGTFAGDRDEALLLCLLDTGARAAEFLAINLEDLNQARGDCLIRAGKGHKPRTVYVGRQSRRALRRYLLGRHDDHPALWVTREGERLGYDGLRAVLTRRAKQAGVTEPTAHDFRRAMALSMLRNGTDVFTLAKLMGHEGIAVLQRYLRQTTADTEQAHRRAGPIDNLGRLM
jgi:site-specific recombinase XerD